MNWDNIVTKKQKKKLIQETLKDLKDLLKLPAVKDILSDTKISLGGYDDNGNYGSLYLTKEGLFEKTGFADSFCSDEIYNMSRSSDPLKIKTNRFREVIETYLLTPDSIEKTKKLLTRSNIKL